MGSCCAHITTGRSRKANGRSRFATPRLGPTAARDRPRPRRDNSPATRCGNQTNHLRVAHVTGICSVHNTARSTRARRTSVRPADRDAARTVSSRASRCAAEPSIRSTLGSALATGRWPPRLPDTTRTPGPPEPACAHLRQSEIVQRPTDRNGQRAGQDGAACSRT